MSEETEKGNAKRFNEGKNRLDLVPTVLIEEVGKVLTFGTNKYGAFNYLSGMDWSKCVASAKRHLTAFENGIDFDEESGLLHLSHLACNVTFLLEYYTRYPQGDDRQHRFLRKQKIGLDIDEVIADFIGALMKKFPEIKEVPVYWNDPTLHKCFAQVIDDEEFWISIEPKVKELPFEPHCYITSRAVNIEITQRWLDMHGFPHAPLFALGSGQSKVEAAKDSGCDVFVDDCYEHFVDLNRAGIFCYLLDAPHNRRYKVGFRRIKSLEEVVDFNNIINHEQDI